ncbi:hypothetical protein OKA04_23285 [Luteolibacter flavescens]|uniref:Uncharacterized protein n=1 Tax=Luteolibacter flavescens TaxID=1859460 RepID=A0ABT3FXF7_9BACT|nr:hypothetical protein [Luteolibacter flavescens]MCW1887680.1 hypothetical protein [Luteolibacter flavescens]
MSEILPLPIPTEAQIKGYPDHVAMLPPAEPGMVGNASFRCGVFRAALMEACQTIDYCRHPDSTPEGRTKAAEAFFRHFQEVRQ